MPFEPEENRRSLFPFGNKAASGETTGQAAGQLMTPPGPGLTLPQMKSPTREPMGDATQNLSALASGQSRSVAPEAHGRAVSAGPVMAAGLLPANGSLRSTPTRAPAGDRNASISLKIPRTKYGRAG
jgi:hypothetical protein